MEEKKATKEQPKLQFEIIEVPTQMGLVFKDNEKEETLDMNQVLLRLLNDVAEIKKNLS